jgi:HAD superfamily hydrolase (TIGR01549 family)
VYCAVAVPYRSDYVAVTADPSLEAVLFDFSHTLFRPEERTQWVQRAAELAGATLAEEEATRLAGEIERLLVADQDAERQVGRDLSPQAHRAAIGGVLSALETTVDGLTDALYERLIAPDAWLPYADTEPVLRALRDAGVRIGVVSNIGWDIRGSFRHHDLHRYVQSYTLSFEHGREKPDPAFFASACQSLDVAPEAALMVGDNPVADGGAARAGLGAYILPGAPVPGRSTVWGADAVGDHRGLGRVLRLLG